MYPQLGIALETTAALALLPLYYFPARAVPRSHRNVLNIAYIVCVVCLLYRVSLLYMIYSCMFIFQTHLHPIIMIIICCSTFFPRITQVWFMSCRQLPKPVFKQTPTSSLQKGELFFQGKQSDIHAGSHSGRISVWITCNATHYALQPGLQLINSV